MAKPTPGGYGVGSQVSGNAIWSGEIEYVQRLSIGAATGQLRHSWTMRVRWTEAGRIDVTDDAGEVVGQLVLLRDDGSSWNANVTGTIRWPHSELTHRGSGSGSSTIRSAVVYRSLTDSDPLTDVLPNGAYAFLSDSTQTFQATATTKTFDPPSTTFARTESPPPLFSVSAFAHSGYASNVQRLPASQLRAFLASKEKAGAVVRDAGIGDTEYRVLEAERMTGQYNVANGGIEHTVTWDIERTFDVQPTIDLAPSDWRPQGGDESNTVEITARLPDGSGLEGKFYFELSEVSTEPGYAMNGGDPYAGDLPPWLVPSGISVFRC